MVSCSFFPAAHVVLQVLLLILLLSLMANVAHYADATSLLMTHYASEKQRSHDDLAVAEQNRLKSQELKHAADLEDKVSKEEQHTSELEKEAAEKARAKADKLSEQAKEEKKASQSDQRLSKLHTCLCKFCPCVLTVFLSIMAFVGQG